MSGRAAEHGYRSVLLADIGLLDVFGRLRRDGELPPDMQAKVSVMLPVANPATARVLAELGADTLNLPTDLTLPQIAAIRAAVDVPLDIYVEAPGHVGRIHSPARHPRADQGSPRPSTSSSGCATRPILYPAGTHLEPTVLAF